MTIHVRVTLALLAVATTILTACGGDDTVQGPYEPAPLRVSKPPPPTGHKVVSVGQNRACLLTTDSTLHCWDPTWSGWPIPESPPWEIETVAVDTWAPLGVVGIRPDGTLVRWVHKWKEAPIEGGLEGEFVAVSVSGNICGIRTDGSIDCVRIIQAETGEPGDDLELPSGSFKDISLGGMHGCAITTSGAIECWQFDNAAWPDEFGVTDAPPGEFTSVSMSQRQACAVTTDGSITCWGFEYAEPVPAEKDFTSVTVGKDQTCGLKSNGQVDCWGRSDGGGGEPSPDLRFTEISSGTEESCGILEDSSYECWDPEQ